MITHLDWLIHLEHHKDLLREAEQERLAQLAVSSWPVRKVKKKAISELDRRSEATQTVCCESSIA